MVSWLLWGKEDVAESEEIRLDTESAPEREREKEIFHAIGLQSEKYPQHELVCHRYRVANGV